MNGGEYIGVDVVIFLFNPLLLYIAQDTTMMLPMDPSQLPDLFVYLERVSGARKGKRVAYLRFDV